MDEFTKTLIAKLTPLEYAKIVFVGFSLPASFGGTNELEFGDMAQTKSMGLSDGATAMGKEFVLLAIEDIFDEDSELEEVDFRLTEDGTTFTVTAI